MDRLNFKRKFGIMETKGVGGSLPEWGCGEYAIDSYVYLHKDPLGSVLKAPLEICIRILIATFRLLESVLCLLKATKTDENIFV